MGAGAGRADHKEAIGGEDVGSATLFLSSWTRKPSAGRMIMLPTICIRRTVLPRLYGRRHPQSPQPYFSAPSSATLTPRRTAPFPLFQVTYTTNHGGMMISTNQHVQQVQPVQQQVLNPYQTRPQ